MVGFSACAVTLPGNRTAAEQFHALKGNGEKRIAKNFYELGQSDEVKNLYWAQRRAQEPGFAGEQPELQRKYVVLPVPSHRAPDGTIIESNNQVVEVVQ